jgi:predicted secreted protein
MILGKNMVKLKNRVFKACVMTCIILGVLVTSAQEANFERMDVRTIVGGQKNILGEPPEEEWNETFGGTNFEEGRFVQQTGDGGYIITGYTSSYGAGGYDIWLIKTDSNGTKEWDKTFGGAEDDKGHSVQQTTDGGYIITGFTYSFGAGGYDVWLIKTDSNGTKEWNKTLGGTNFDEGFSVQQTTDGGYIITGRTSSYGNGGHDVWLIKTDSHGSEEWNQTYGGTLYDYGYSVQQTTDGGYIIAGFSGSGHFDVWLIKTDFNGIKEWDEIFGGVACDGAYSVQQTTDGGYILVGTTSSFGAGGSDAWLIKTDSDGNKEWDELFGGTNVEVGFSVQQTNDDGYIITGYIFTYSNQNYDAWLVKTDSDGNKEWDNTFGDTDVDAGNFGQQTADGGYIITGRTASYGYEGCDVWLIRIETENNPPYKPSEPIPENNSLNVDIDTNISWMGGDPDNDTVKYDVYFGTTNPPIKIISNQTETYYNPGILEYDKIYYWRIVAWDYYIPCTNGPIWTFTTHVNQPPSPPLINGSKSGNIGETYLYTFVSEDPEGHNVSYEIDWGEGSVEPWDGPHDSNVVISRNHSWSKKEIFTIMARAKDSYGSIGEWGTLEVTMPKNKHFNFNFPLLNWLFERFPNAFLILKYMLRLQT